MVEFIECLFFPTTIINLPQGILCFVRDSFNPRGHPIPGPKSLVGIIIPVPLRNELLMITSLGMHRASRHWFTCRRSIQAAFYSNYARTHPKTIWVNLCEPLNKFPGATSNASVCPSFVVLSSGTTRAVGHFGWLMIDWGAISEVKNQYINVALYIFAQQHDKGYHSLAIRRWLRADSIGRAIRCWCCGPGRAPQFNAISDIFVTCLEDVAN